MRPRISCQWRRGVVPTAILSGPIHILRKRDGERTVGDRGKGEGAKVVPAWDEAGWANGKTCFWHDKKPRTEVDARFLSHSNRVAQMLVYLCFFIFHEDDVSLKIRLRGLLLRRLNLINRYILRCQI